MAHHHPADNIFTLHLSLLVRHRIPWLLLGLIGGIATASIVSSFEEVLSHNLILAAYIPLIVYMADAVGTQMESFIIRDLATTKHFQFGKYFYRQLVVLVIMGLLLSTALGGMSFYLHQDATISGILSISLLLAIMSSAVTGLVVPFLFNRFDLDPANASGPTATIIQDMVSVSVYLLVAQQILQL